jgi:hypothetical protein
VVLAVLNIWILLPQCPLRYTQINFASLDDGGVGESPGRVKNFLFSTSSRPALRSTQPLIQWVPGALSPGVKRPGPEADHSPPTIAEVKKRVKVPGGQVPGTHKNNVVTYGGVSVTDNNGF